MPQPDRLATLLGTPSRRKITDPGTGGFGDRGMSDAVRLSSLQDQRARELSRFGEGPDAQRELTQLESDIAENPDTGMAARARQQKFQQLADFFRPDAARQREEEQAFELERAGEPARVGGPYAVESARQTQLGRLRSDQQREQSDLRRIQAQSDLEGQRQEGLATRLERGSTRRTLEQRLQALQTGKAHAAAPGNAFGRWLSSGPSQQELDEAEITKILSQLGATDESVTGGSESEISSPPARGPATGTRRTIRGQPAVWDGQGWVAE